MAFEKTCISRCPPSLPLSRFRTRAPFFPSVLSWLCHGLYQCILHISLAFVFRSLIPPTTRQRRRSRQQPLHTQPLITVLFQSASIHRNWSTWQIGISLGYPFLFLFSSLFHPPPHVICTTIMESVWHLQTQTHSLDHSSSFLRSRACCTNSLVHACRHKLLSQRTRIRRYPHWSPLLSSLVWSVGSKDKNEKGLWFLSLVSKSFTIDFSLYRVDLPFPLTLSKHHVSCMLSTSFFLLYTFFSKKINSRMKEWKKEKEKRNEIPETK